jgi:hypothetical protein
MGDSKSPVQSKTLIFNGIALAVALALHFGYGAFEPAPEVDEIAGGIVAVVTVLLPILSPIINMVLRLVTSKPVKANLLRSSSRR